MSFSDWLASSISKAFGESAPRKALPERSLELAEAHFFQAIEREHVEDITRIAERYPAEFLTWRDARDQTPLQAAQNSNSLPSFVELVSLGANKYESWGNGWSPLMAAFRQRDEEFINYLLGPKTPDLNAIAKSGEQTFTLLHMAVMNRDIARVLELVELGADQNVKAKPDKRLGEVTPEELALKLKLPKIAEVLHNADGIREVKRKEWAELEEFAKQNTYVPRGEDAVPVRNVQPAEGEVKQTTIVVDTPKQPPVIPPMAPKAP